MRFSGLVFIVVALLLPIFWYAPLVAPHDGPAIFSQYLGSVALIAMAISQIMATRVVGLETLFGSLDRIYVQHKWLGIIAVVCILLHDTIDADLINVGRATFLTDLAETAGEISLNGILILLVITVVTFIPYHLWLWTHKLMGAFFTASAFHFVFIMKPFEVMDPLGLYVTVFCALGVVAYIFTLLPFSMKSGGAKYKVSDVQHMGDVTSVELSPVGSGMSHRAGQFAFIQLDQSGLNDVHPFTISKAPSADRSLRFTVKNLGDYTRKFGQNVAVGDLMRVSKSHGRFYRNNRKAEIWIAAGIGITPFLAWAQHIKTSGEALTNPVHLFYCVKDRETAAHFDELQSYLDIENFNLHVIESAPRSNGMKQRLSADLIEEYIDFPISKAAISYCGPEGLRKSLKKALSKKGVASRNFHFEEFEIRSGIGLRRLLNWILSYFSKNMQIR